MLTQFYEIQSLALLFKVKIIELLQNKMEAKQNGMQRIIQVKEEESN